MILIDTIMGSENQKSALICAANYSIGEAKLLKTMEIHNVTKSNIAVTMSFFTVTENRN